MVGLDKNEADLFALVNRTLRDIGCVDISQYISSLDAPPSALQAQSNLVRLVNSPTGGFPLSQVAKSDPQSTEILARFSANVLWFAAFSRETNLYGGVVYMFNGKAYSTAATHEGPSEAKAAVSLLAIQQGVLDLPVPSSSTPSSAPSTNATPESDSSQKIINFIQQAQANVHYCFLYIRDDHEHLYGAVLRVWQGHDQDHAITCVVLPHYSNTSMAKNAVAARALEQGDIPRFITQCQSEVKNKVTPNMRQYAIRTLYNRILNEWKRASEKESAEGVEWIYTQDLQASGCEMRFNVPSAYSCIVGPEYGSRADAKVACAFKAVSTGVLEILRFGNKGVPPDYVPLEKNICEAIMKGEDIGMETMVRKKQKRMLVPNADTELEDGEIAETRRKRRRKHKGGTANENPSKSEPKGSLNLLPGG